MEKEARYSITVTDIGKKGKISRECRGRVSFNYKGGFYGEIEGGIVEGCITDLGGMFIRVILGDSELVIGEKQGSLEKVTGKRGVFEGRYQDDIRLRVKIEENVDSVELTD